MNEVVRPLTKPGDFDWDKAPEELFIKTSLLASSAKVKPVKQEALGDFSSLKRIEGQITLIKSQLQRQDQRIGEGQIDAFFNKKARKNLYRQLRRAKNKLTTVSQRMVERRRSNSDFENAAQDIDTNFAVMECLLNSKWDQLEPNSQAVLDGDLLKLIDFFLRN